VAAERQNVVSGPQIIGARTRSLLTHDQTVGHADRRMPHEDLGTAEVDGRPASDERSAVGATLRSDQDE
jgi:hypothetical protein